MTRSLSILCAVLALLILGSCGKKGELEPPEGYERTGQLQHITSLA